MTSASLLLDNMEVRSESQLTDMVENYQTMKYIPEPHIMAFIVLKAA